MGPEIWLSWRNRNSKSLKLPKKNWNNAIEFVFAQLKANYGLQVSYFFRNGARKLIVIQV